MLETCTFATFERQLPFCLSFPKRIGVYSRQPGTNRKEDHPMPKFMRVQIDSTGHIHPLEPAATIPEGAAVLRVSDTVTRAPSPRRNSAAANPDFPNPTTNTRLPFNSIVAMQTA